MFELKTNRHRRIVNNKREAIVLHGVRDLVSLQEVEFEPYAVTLS